MKKKVFLSVIALLILLLAGALALYFSAMNDMSNAMTQIKAAVAVEDEAKAEEPEADQLVSEIEVLKAKAEKAADEEEFNGIRDQAKTKLERLRVLNDSMGQKYAEGKRLRQQSKDSMDAARWKLKWLLMPLPAEGADPTK